MAFIGNVTPPARQRHTFPWVHLALDPENLGAAEGVDFDLTVSYLPGADIDIAAVVFRRVENRGEIQQIWYLIVACDLKLITNFLDSRPS